MQVGDKTAIQLRIPPEDRRLLNYFHELAHVTKVFAHFANPVTRFNYDNASANLYVYMNCFKSANGLNRKIT